MPTDSLNEDRYANLPTLTHSDWWLSFFFPHGGNLRVKPSHSNFTLQNNQKLSLRSGLVFFQLLKPPDRAILSTTGSTGNTLRGCTWSVIILRYQDWNVSVDSMYYIKMIIILSAFMMVVQYNQNKTTSILHFATFIFDRVMMLWFWF